MDSMTLWMPVRPGFLAHQISSNQGCAPDAGSTKKVVREYTKAILMNGTKGKLLTEAAVKLEGEAYHMGYYKAFALTSLSSGPSDAT